MMDVPSCAIDLDRGRGIFCCPDSRTLARGGGGGVQHGYISPPHGCFDSWLHDTIMYEGEHVGGWVGGRVSGVT